jgi:hypothetical protein
VSKLLKVALLEKEDNLLTGFSIVDQGTRCGKILKIRYPEKGETICQMQRIGCFCMRL